MTHEEAARGKVGTKTIPHGFDLLHDPSLNKGTAFTKEEREALGLEGLLPVNVHTQEEQVMRVMENFERKPDDRSGNNAWRRRFRTRGGPVGGFHRRTRGGRVARRQ